MQNPDPHLQLGTRPRQPGLLPKILTVLAGAVILAAAIAFSIIVFAVLIGSAALFGIYFWWKTRHLRKQMRETRPRYEGNVYEGNVIEGESTRRDDSARR